MKIDKDKLAALLAMPDDKLWAEVRAIASSHGITLPTAPPPPEEMANLRGAVSGGAKLNFAEAVRVINNYTKRGKK